MTGLHTRPAAPGTIVAGRPLPVFRHIGVEPLTGAAGCKITGVDLRRPLTEDSLAEILLAFEHFLVVMFRGQNLTPEQHKTFSRHFGALTELPQAPIYAGDPLMQEVRREADEPESVVPFSRFHTDSPFLPEPPLAIVMRAHEVPRFGGDTAFANMFLVYESLSAGLQETLTGLNVIYSGRDIWSRNEKLEADRRLRLREHHGFTGDQLENEHPAVRTHPRTGRRGLYVTRAYFKRFAGWSEEESRGLLDYLAGLPGQLRFQCRIRWQPDTLIVWDNRFLQHCGVHDYNNERRHLVRTTIKGERPAGD